jgi:FkbM family methyltransferase
VAGDAALGIVAGEPASKQAWRRALRALSRKPWYRRPKLLLKRLAGREPWLGRDIRPTLRCYSDWALSAERLERGTVLYALGVGTDLNLELDLAREFGLEVHAFDPSPESVRWASAQHLPPNVQFHAWAVSEHDGRLQLRARETESKSNTGHVQRGGSDAHGAVVEVESLCLETIARRLGHTHVTVVKMDIEGAEYGVLRSLLGGMLRPEVSG